MSNETTYSPPEKPRADVSELQKFTRCFTKDWRLHSGSFLQIAAHYIQQLPPDRKAVLTKEFRAFLYDSNAASDEALLQLWYAQGAEVWDFDVTIRPVMTDFYWLMNPDAPELESPADEIPLLAADEIGRDVAADRGIIDKERDRSPSLLRDSRLRKREADKIIEYDEKRLPR